VSVTCPSSSSFTLTPPPSSSSKNARQPEESGPFGRNRSIRYTSSVSGGRRASTRAGTTPSRQKENSAVADFSRLFAKEQATGVEHNSLPVAVSTEGGGPESAAVEKVPTECLLYGYRAKNSEWKVLSRYERIVTPGIICEDYPREDPMLFTSTNSPMGFHRSSITVHQHLSREALQKSRVYKGGNHWIKVTFDSYEAAERACFYSPVEIDGCMVTCEMWNGRGPLSDAPVPTSAGVDGALLSTRPARTVGVQGGRASAVAGFEQAMTGTLPRSHTAGDVQFGQPFASSSAGGARDDMDVDVLGSDTASSATATSPPQASTGLQVQQTSGSSLRSRSVPNLPSQNASADPALHNSSRIPGVRRIALRPVTEALPPQQSFLERLLRTVPVVNWALGFTTPVRKDGVEKAGEKEKVGLIGEGPAVKDDGTFDQAGNGWYWKLWHTLDRVAGTDFCGLKED